MRSRKNRNVKCLFHSSQWELFFYNITLEKTNLFLTNQLQVVLVEPHKNKHNPFPVGEGYFRNIAIKSFVCITVLKMPPWY